MYFSVDVGRSCVDYFFGNLFRDTIRLVTVNFAHGNFEGRLYTYSSVAL